MHKFDHEYILNKLLSNDCPSYVDERGYSIFYVDLHCTSFKIVAEAGDWDPTFKICNYKIIEMEEVYESPSLF